MPVSRVQRRMRGQWSVVLKRADGYARRLPPEGVSRGRFVADVLGDVDPGYTDEIVEIMGRKGIVWLSTYRGEVTVYGSKPEARPERELVGKRGTDALLADLGPLLSDAASMAERLKPFGSSPEVEEGARVAIGRIILVCERHALKGVPLADMRACLWRVLSSRLMSAIARQEPRLQERSEADAFAVTKAKPKRLPKGLTVKGKVRAIVERAGVKGITKTDVIQGIRPKPSTSELADVIGELETEGALVWGEMRKDAASRPGVRLFAASVGLPKVHDDGVMWHRE